MKRKKTNYDIYEAFKQKKTLILMVYKTIVVLSEV